MFENDFLFLASVTLVRQNPNTASRQGQCMEATSILTNFNKTGQIKLQLLTGN